jgi:hypothetical protein
MDSIKTHLEMILESQLSNNAVRESDYKFYHGAELIRFVELSEIFEENCGECKCNIAIIEELATHLDEYLSGSITKRKEFETRFFGIQNHLKQAHDVAVKDKLSSQYVVYGILAGGVAGIGFSQIINRNSLQMFVSVGIFMGMVLGNLLGKHIEKSRRKHKLFF